MVVSFHHRNGPQVDYCYPPLRASDQQSKHPTDNSNVESPVINSTPVELPKEWSFMPFICLPDGAHSSTEEFIYFHLPESQHYKPLFGLACFRQINASELVKKTADITRTKVQKSVVLLATFPILGSIRNKLGLVTEAFFGQKDFSQLDMINDLYDNLAVTIKFPISDGMLFMGLSVREFVYKFKQKTLQLVKLLLLGKRILFFGQRVEKASVMQYSLVSLIPGIIT